MGCHMQSHVFTDMDIKEEILLYALYNAFIRVDFFVQCGTVLVPGCEFTSSFLVHGPE